MTMINSTASVKLARFASLSMRISAVIKDIVRQSYKDTKVLIAMLLEMEMTQVNTNHPDFIGSRKTLGQLIAKVSNEVVPQNFDEDSSECSEGSDDEAPPTAARGASKAGDNAPVFKIEIIEALLLKKLLKSYFKVVRKKVADSVPKAIQLKLVDSVQRQMQSELVGTLYTNDEEQIMAIMSDSPELEKRRTQLVKAVGLLEVAQEAIYVALSRGERK